MSAAIDYLQLYIDLDQDISRKLRNSQVNDYDGHVIYVHGDSNLTLVDNGGAIYLESGNTLSITNVTIQNNSAYENSNGNGKADAIYNNGGTLSLTNCTIANNSAVDVGGVYNKRRNPEWDSVLLWLWLLVMADV